MDLVRCSSFEHYLLGAGGEKGFNPSEDVPLNSKSDSALEVVIGEGPYQTPYRSLVCGHESPVH